MEIQKLLMTSFTEDESLKTPFWDNFWNDEGAGASTSDPDAESKQLQQCHKAVWGNRELPCGKIMNLKDGEKCSLVWEEENFVFSSDWFINTYIHWKSCAHIMKELKDSVANYEDYKNYQKYYIGKTYTIGGSIIFPQRIGGINTSRAKNNINDRADLTLECIRRYYEGNENNPLKEVLEQDSRFFNLFNDFKGYVDFFFLNDLVAPDYKSVNIIFGNSDFKDVGYPKTTDEWIKWQRDTIDFIDNRNSRIWDKFVKEK